MKFIYKPSGYTINQFINTYKKSIIGDNTKLKKTGWKIKHILKYKKIV